LAASAAYGQRDPLVEYKKEGLKLFQTMEETYASHVRSLIPNIVSTPSAQISSPQQRSVTKAVASITASSDTLIKKEYGRNDKVIISNGAETKEMKYKKAEQLLSEGWRIVG
ncbi:MAG: hypothetical protein Athens041674_637, partial [Parcubacteria group bacterium Athens0416_74]